MHDSDCYRTFQFSSDAASKVASCLGGPAAGRTANNRKVRGSSPRGTTFCSNPICVTTVELLASLLIDGFGSGPSHSSDWIKSSFEACNPPLFTLFSSIMSCESHIQVHFCNSSVDAETRQRAGDLQIFSHHIPYMISVITYDPQ